MTPASFPWMGVPISVGGNYMEGILAGARAQEKASTEVGTTRESR